MGDQPGESLHGGLDGTSPILAEQVQAKFNSTAEALDARFPPTVQDFDDVGIFEFVNTSYGISVDSGTYVDCGVAFVAPSSGRVMIYWTAVVDIAQASNASAYVSPVVRTGGTVGSGSTVLPAADNNARRATRSTVGTDEGGSRNRAGCSYLLTGLTPGSTYNVRLEHRVTSQTGETFHRAVQVVPAT